jgi:hypothetical protein
MIFRTLPLLLALASCTDPALATRPQTSCQTGYVEWQDRPFSDLIAGSRAIFLATAQEFVPDTSVEGFDGYYLVSSTGTEIKGGAQGLVKIYGQVPYPYPPQIYFDIPNRHQELADRHREFGQTSLPGGISGVTNIGTHCPLAPRFVIGYQYLIMLGTESPLSFEPIHAARSDAWFLLVRDAVEAEENR